MVYISSGYLYVITLVIGRGLFLLFVLLQPVVSTLFLRVSACVFVCVCACVLLGH